MSEQKSWKKSVMTKLAHKKSEIFKVPALAKMARAIIELSLSFFLSQATILGSISPFGLAFISASCLKGRGFFAIIGGFIGYFSSNVGLSAMKYLAAAILVITASYIVRDFKIRDKRIFMPLATGLSIIFTGSMFLMNEGFSVFSLLLFFSEIILTMSLTYFYTFALEKAEENESITLVGQFALFGSVLIAFYPVTIAQILSPSRLVALLIVLFVSYVGGFTKGAVMGVNMGIVLDAAAGGTPFFIGTYAFSALIAGVFNGGGRVIFSCVYIIANATVSLLGIDDARYLSGIYESLLGTIIFLFLPNGFFDYVRIKMQGETVKTGDYVKKVQDIAKKYANDASSVFHEMYVSMTHMPESAVPNLKEDINMIFDSATNKICKKCVLCNVCWEKEYVSTFKALQDVSKAMLERERAVPEDFPIHFSTRCIKFPSFLIYINEGIATILAKRKYKEKIRSNKVLIAEQYAGITSVLRQIAFNLNDVPEFIPLSEKKLKKYAEAFGGIKYATCYRDPAGHIRAELSGEGIVKILEEGKSFSEGLSAILGVKFATPIQICDSEGERILVKQKEVYSVEVGKGSSIRPGNRINGDSCTYFVTDYGKAYFLLCDGMGSGASAYAESLTAQRLIERFLRVGISPEEALRTISPAIKIRNEQLSFVTVDIAQIDLFTGACELYKCGAAPTFLLTNDKIRKITGTAMPVGIAQTYMCDVTRFKLSENDMLIMITDGLSDENDSEIIRLIREYSKNSPSDLCANIIKNSNESQDDKSILSIKFFKN